MLDNGAQDFWLDQLGQAQAFNRWVFSHFAQHLQGDVLEIGCGSGNFTVLMAAAGHRVTGVDLHAPYVDTARARLAGYPAVSVMCADATSSEFEAQYDTVVMLDVLEHIEDHIGFMTKLRGALRPGGRIILKVPAYQWLMCDMDRAIGHFRRYDRPMLKAALAQAGFDLVEQHYFNLPAVAGWLVNGKILGQTTPPAEQLAAFERLVPLFKWLERALPVPAGVSLIAVGRVAGGVPAGA
jgi:SAM-dependent methyltransferase